MKSHCSLISHHFYSLRTAAVTVVAAVGVVCVLITPVVVGEEPQALANESLPSSETEAVGRARWLHEMVHGSLQVMHRDFFGDGDDDGLSLPSQSLEDVFKEMSRSWSVDFRWLGGNATQDKEHEAQDKFEEDAVKALISGKLEYSKVEGRKFRYVGAITLHNQCLKCHVPQRKTMEDRVAGLSITMKMKAPSGVDLKPKAEKE